jgi:hypothetical protein
MLKTPTIAAALALAIGVAGPAHAGTFICVPSQAGVAVVSGGPSGTCNTVSTPVELPSSAADQKTLLKLLQYVKFSDAGLPNGQTTTTNTPLITFKGVNVLVKKGDGVAGTGNVLVGNQEVLNPTTRTGSDNLIVGTGHSWTGSTNLVAGSSNTANGNYGLFGGLYNSANGGGNVVFGGYNRAGDQFGSVLSGAYNTATGMRSTVAGGTKNSATGQYATVLGGNGRTATAAESVIADGKPTAKTLWAKFDGNGAVIASSEPVANQYGSTWYALAMFAGVDIKKCAVSVQSAGGRYAITTWSEYYGYVYARSIDHAGNVATGVPYDIVATCPV